MGCGNGHQLAQPRRVPIAPPARHCCSARIPEKAAAKAGVTKADLKDLFHER
jgi:hypothetical protein